MGQVGSFCCLLARLMIRATTSPQKAPASAPAKKNQNIAPGPLIVEAPKRRIMAEHALVCGSHKRA